MAWTFTAAAERVLAEAMAWNSRDDRDDLHEPELLLGLLAESECRAANMLLGRGVDSASVQQQWPNLHRNSNGAAAGRDFSPSLLVAFQAAVDRMWEYPRPLTLATEHILLGLVAAQGEASSWLATYGFDADALEGEIHRLYGHDPTPLPVEIEPEKSAAPTEMAAQRGPQASSTGDAGGVELVGHHAAALYRVLDAAANRAREGLRVVEDFARMVLNDQHLTRELKQLRHSLQSALSPLTKEMLLTARDTLADVGTQISTESEMAREDLSSVMAANWHRVEEALRSVEEYSKVVLPSVAAAIEPLRYRTYTLERAMAITATSNERLAGIRLCVLVDGRADEAEFARLVETLVTAEVGMLQFRDKRLDDRELLGRALRLRQITRGTRTLFIVNDRADIAAISDADGVHVGQDDLPIKAARRVVGPQTLVGVSTHSIAQARQAVLEGASYIGVGPTFQSTTKTFATLAGLELVQAVSGEIRLPALAIGGINRDNLEAVLATGIHGVAVSAAVVAADDPAGAAREFALRLAAQRSSPTARA